MRIRTRFSFPFHLRVTLDADVRVLLVHNPTAGEDGLDIDELVSLLEGAGHEVESHSIKKGDWADAISPAIELVAVAGGDGTVRKVFRQLAGRDQTATLLPVGTANNIARSLGFEDDEDPARLVRGWPQARRRWCDLGFAVSTGGEVKFVESAGGGIFAEVLSRAKQDDRKLGGEAKLEFGLRTLRAVVADAPALEWGVRADDVDLSGELLAVEAMNVREIGPNILVAPGADPGDGVLELTLIGAGSRSALADYLETRLDHRSPDPLELDVHRASRIVLRPPAGCPVHIDQKPAELADLTDDMGRIMLEVDDGLHVLVPEVP
jgi:diacylglycerol kinase (ATP)